MKNLIFICFASLFCTTVSAQYITSEQIQKFNIDKWDGKKDGIGDYVAAATTLKDTFKLDINNQLSLVSIVQCPNMTKTDIYKELNYWFITSFINGKSVIQLNDNENGIIIGNGYLDRVAVWAGFAKAYSASEHIIIRIDIKDNRFRVTTTIQAYEVYNLSYGEPVGDKMDWMPYNCFPFVDTSNDRRYKFTSKAYVSAYIYSKLMINNMSKAVLEGITGNEKNEW